MRLYPFFVLLWSSVATQICDPTTFQKDIDYHGEGQGLGHVNSTSATACCQLCTGPVWKPRGCNYFGFASNVCWLKAGNSSPRSKKGVISGKCVYVNRLILCRSRSHNMRVSSI
jgi:hypothetical protein